jgi:hypothetical protein
LKTVLLATGTLRVAVLLPAAKVTEPLRVP